MNKANEGGSILSLVEQSIDWLEVDDLFGVLPCRGSGDVPSIPPFKGNMTKFASKGTLLAKIRHWISSKLDTVKVLSVDRSYEMPLLPSPKISCHDSPMQINNAEPPPHLHFDAKVCLPVLVDGRTILEGIVSTRKDERISILQCSQHLYRRLWWWRCIVGQDVTQVTGFSIWICPVQGRLSVSILQLQMPSSTPDFLGAKLPLRVQTRRSTQASGNSLVQALGSFLVAESENCRQDLSVVPCSSAGATMILSQRMRERIENSVGYGICSTTTGSLVVRCANHTAVQNLLHSHRFSSMNLRLDGDSNDGLGLAWYVKCKTPVSFGPFWDTAHVAINGTRARLLNAQRFLSDAQTKVACKWLLMHPWDAIISPHCHIVVVRDMGFPFRGQIAWPNFAQAYLELTTETLIFQRLTQLVHGDIHENNILCRQEPSSSSLVLIDWDEALQRKPCTRASPTVEERLRYPSALIDFPEAYTKQQFLHLFHRLIQEYYRWMNVGAWEEYSGGDRHHHEPVVASVDRRFRAMQVFLRENIMAECAGNNKCNHKDGAATRAL